jgi:hypothetical protein
MFSKTKMALAAALVLGLASAAQAGDKDDADVGGGYRVGPLGQSFDSGVNPVYHPSLSGKSASGRSANAYVDPYQRPHKKANSR